MRDTGASLTSLPGRHAGMVSQGNINLRGRPVVRNSDGSISTERSFSIGTARGETLIPQIVHGKLLSQQAAIRHFQKTGENLGVFKSPAFANRYAILLHLRQQRSYR